MVCEVEKSNKETNNCPTYEIQTEPIEFKPKTIKQEHGSAYWSNETNNIESFDFDSTIEIKMEPVG